ncbi:hypothetical protein DFH27DRAFT_249230 [Peziza echinospora]|nr:hypothetical protein DFH27DRAFT_249230 [Peziza echinospora]
MFLAHAIVSYCFFLSLCLFMIFAASDRYLLDYEPRASLCFFPCSCSCLRLVYVVYVGFYDGTGGAIANKNLGGYLFFLFFFLFPFFFFCAL